MVEKERNAWAVVDPEIEKINNMSQVDMAVMWRFAPSGHPWFDSRKPYFKVFERRFKELGGFTPEISKKIDRETPRRIIKSMTIL